MLVMLELPFNTVDKVAFQNFMRVIQPRLNIVSCTTVRKEVLNIYGEDMSKLKRLISTCERVSLTVDIWTSNQTLSYVCLTGHFIDDSWKLHKKILNFCMVPAPHSEEVMADVVEMCSIEWNICKLTTITLDNASTDVINPIVQDGLHEIKESVIVIRGSVKYVRGSQARKQQFEERVLKEGISNKKGLCIDVCTRWNSTFLMLESAVQFESAFTRLKARDSNFAREAPTIDDWKKAKVICTFLKVFFDATKLFSGHKYTTSNLYFYENFEIQVRLRDMANHDDVSINLMAKKMQIKFDKYWKECNAMFAIAVVLDPKYKIEYLSFMYDEIFSKDEANAQVSCIKRETFAIYDKYVSIYNARQKRVVHSMEKEPEVDSGTCSESAFSTGGRVLDNYRSLLSPGIVQALVCTQDWLRDDTCEDTNEEVEIYQHENDIEIIESELNDVLGAVICSPLQSLMTKIK
ncbi:zinc finger BED domain-containing protein RICESLEEPER 2-like [Tasmannia lanceolata]|uniref:zinc finger BED domain-containing protein RICESLEEPER 2-like n=1 Tax=Tasmannia lanceolata TaxID=3420 RepID=UPI0040642F73